MKKSFFKTALYIFAFVFFFSAGGCRAQRLPYSTGVFEKLYDEPEWVFHPPRITTYEGEKVLMAVGVDSHAFDYESRLRAATGRARGSIKETVRDIILRKGRAAALEAGVEPQAIAFLFDFVDETANSVSQQIADKVERRDVHESLLRGEVFVKASVPLVEVISSINAQLQLFDAVPAYRVGEDVKTLFLDKFLKAVDSLTNQG